MGLRQRLQELLGLHQETGSYGGESYEEMDDYADASNLSSGYDEGSPYSSSHSSNTVNNVVAMPGVSSAQAELVIMEPLSFQEVPAAVIALRERKVVVLNLGNLDADEAQRSVDYVAGGTFALDGHQERIGKCVFLFTPHSVQITAQTAAAMTAQGIVTANVSRMETRYPVPGYPPPPPPPYPGHLTPEQEMLRKLDMRGNSADMASVRASRFE